MVGFKGLLQLLYGWWSKSATAVTSGPVIVVDVDFKVTRTITSDFNYTRTVTSDINFNRQVTHDFGE